MLSTLALMTVMLTGLYFVALALVSLRKPERAASFLLGFASSAAAHYLELFLRLVIGGAFVLRAPLMAFPEIFSIMGWVLLGTSAGLLLIPWQWHQRFAQHVVPQALRYLKLMGLCSFALGIFIIASATLGSG